MTPLKLYTYFRSSSTYRVRIALELKKIPYTAHPVHLLKDGGEQNQAWYRSINPTGEIPFLMTSEKQGLGQSMAILEYLDEVFPKPKLLPDDPYLRGKVRQVAEVINSGIQPIQNLRVLQTLSKEFGATEVQTQEWCQKWITNGFSALETLIQPTASTYSFGKAVCLADLYIVPQVFNALRFHVNMKDYPTIQRVYENCMKLDAFVQADPEHQPDTPKV